MQTTVLDALSFDEAEVEELEVTGSVVIDEGAKLSLRSNAPSTIEVATVSGDPTRVRFDNTISGATAIHLRKGETCVMSLGNTLPLIYVAYANDNKNLVDMTLVNNEYTITIAAETEATYVFEHS
jgi:hypothetical protein